MEILSYLINYNVINHQTKINIINFNMEIFTITRILKINKYFNLE
jgi:hypothetical protein